MKKAFTLAEVMITLTVIGIITSVIIPVAINSKPDENIMKFKKAHNTLYQVISELVNSDKYYLNGDLGMRSNGEQIDMTHENDITYFCESFSDVLSSKRKNCANKNLDLPKISEDYVFFIGDSARMKEGKKIADDSCKKITQAGNEIVALDNITFYQTAPNYTFGIYWKKSLEYSKLNFCIPPNEKDNFEICENGRLFSSPEKIWHTDYTNYAFDRVYKIFCIDIDGIPSGGSENCDDIKDICPFGYGIRADGKILTGARADSWLEKSIQGES